MEQVALRSFVKIPGVGASAASVGNACIYVLSEAKGMSPVPYLVRIKQKVPQKQTKEKVEKVLKELASKRGLTPDRLEELAVPELGFVQGEKHELLGDFSLELEIQNDTKVRFVWKDADGKSRKTIPAAINRDFKLKKRYNQLREESKYIRSLLSLQKVRLDRSYLHDQSWTFAEWRHFYHDHGLMHVISRDLIWDFRIEDQWQSVIWESGEWQNAQGKAVLNLSEQMQVRLWHPIFSETKEILVWRKRLMEQERRQAFKQAFREIYLLTDAEINTQTYSNRMAAHIIKQHQFNALAGQRGWKYSLIGAFDHGLSNQACTIPIPAHALQAELWINELMMEYDADTTEAGIWKYIATDQLRFVSTQTESVVELVDIPPSTYSQTLNR